MTTQHVNDSPDREVLLADSRLEVFRGARALVTGGLGFVGSNTARALVTLGASVVVVDSLASDQGGNRFNLEGVVDRVDVRIADIRDEAAVTDAVQGADFVFSTAASVSHLDSLESPFHDLDVNARGTLTVLEAVRRTAPAARVVYAGTRSEYGLIQTNPVREDHPLLPTEANSAHKALASMYHTAYHIAHGLNTTTMRLTTIYGPRMLVQHWRQGFINWFVRLAVEGGTFRLYGDGSQLRDLVYVDDTVRAMLLAAVAPGTGGQAFNIGCGEPVSLRKIAETLVDITGRGAIECVPFPEEAKRIEIGDYVADVTKIGAVLAWQPLVSLREGLERSVRYYEAYREHYW
jgi:UDP-glucose 4-epimerase